MQLVHVGKPEEPPYSKRMYDALGPIHPKDEDDESTYTNDGDDTYTKDTSSDENQEDDMQGWKVIIEAAYEKIKDAAPNIPEDEYWDDPTYSHYTLKALKDALTEQMSLCSSIRDSTLYKTLKKTKNKLEKEGYENWEATTVAFETRKWLVKKTLVEAINSNQEEEEDD